MRLDVTLLSTASILRKVLHLWATEESWDVKKEYPARIKSWRQSRNNDNNNNNHNHKLIKEEFDYAFFLNSAHECWHTVKTIYQLL